MKYNQIKELEDENFRRLTGVQCPTFEKMIDIFRDADQQKKSRGGCKNKLTLEEQLLMALEYIREYRIYFHIGQNYGVSENSAYKTSRWVENTLIKHRDFALPGRKVLQGSKVEHEIVLIDATETPIERPKKTKALLFRQEEKTYVKKPGSGRQKNKKVFQTENAMIFGCLKNQVLTFILKLKSSLIRDIRE